MRRILTLLLLLGLLLSFQPAHAQGTPGLSSVEAWIWPEYDKPSVLVIYHIMVSDQTALPATFEFRIPSSAQKPHTVAVGETPNTVSDQNVQYTLEQDGEWLKVVVNVTAPAITLEYYDPSLIIEGKTRTINYVWPGDYSVDSFTVQVQQPYDASQFKSSPVLTQMGKASDRLTYYLGEFGSLAQGEPFMLNVNYQKASDAVSKELMPVEPSAPVDENTAGRVSLTTYLPWLAGGFGVLLVAAGLYSYLRGQPRPSQRRKRHTVQTEGDSEQVYCSQCGTRARSGDRFCRTCGTRLRGAPEE